MWDKYYVFMLTPSKGMANTTHSSSKSFQLRAGTNAYIFILSYSIFT